ncbi:Krueppel-like factor 13 [Platysternon megacephalum]|uniref:Krueppel-like factor 13 n=1 Tax=Platysternon megacephalum TaxID=55544 RepID=A0A4D9EB69_9SAUR|nr:Krueppel-like factor 13 [Platysternon megacephalum]
MAPYLDSLRTLVRKLSSAQSFFQTTNTFHLLNMLHGSSRAKKGPFLQLILLKAVLYKPEEDSHFSERHIFNAATPQPLLGGRGQLSSPFTAIYTATSTAAI